MNRDDLKLERLFAAARSAEPAPVEEMPPYLASRVIAHWRAGALRTIRGRCSCWFFGAPCYAPAW